VDIYENPSEHYSSIEPQFLPTLQPSHSRPPYAGLKPRYYMESNNGPQLKVGYGECFNLLLKFFFQRSCPRWGANPGPLDFIYFLTFTT
jgi:hypothetical protein